MLYFAYGSNLNKKQMKNRCPDSVPVVKVILKNYKLVFNYFADVVETPGEIVYGAVYDVSNSDIRKLNRYEGYPRHYDIINIKVEDDEGKAYKAFAYVMTSKGIREPEEHYYNIIKHGFKDWNLPLEKLMNARKLI
jgi:gamma-glutamylcyclotransferase (GGCT)/AIG2-like uncharacterized protein YtfP